MVLSIFFSNLFKGDSDKFLPRNFDKLPRSVALFFSKNFNYKNLSFSIKQWSVHCYHNKMLSYRRETALQGAL